MRHAVFLAWRNLNAGRLRSAILVCCLTVAVSLPIVLHVVVGRFQKQLTQRAAATPLIVGATGRGVTALPPAESGWFESRWTLTWF